MRIAKIHLPLLLLAIVFVTIFSIKTFGSDGPAIGELGGSLRAAGYTIQIMFLQMVLYDSLIVLTECRSSGEPIKLMHIARLYRYWNFCRLNTPVLIGLSIWSTIALNGEAATECSAMDGCSDFLLALKVNMIVGYIYSAGHCCFPGPCILGYLAYKAVDEQRAEVV